ncbi:glutamine-hydrolyzing GMP synthase [Spiroplasma endosymbiont of Anurida maritima]|uniref:glutamine-hydrolyzing GMP synthase n=1 Tax=Spiroplasma endosymbiont of Anurida maritima TaxID=2967972 RepID=UPI0036D28D6B
MEKTQIIILDFGSQYTQLLARRIRELNVLAKVVNKTISANKLKKYENLKGIILSGGPDSVYNNQQENFDKEILNLNIPILGVCYGLQLIAHSFGGIVTSADKQEFGKASLNIVDNNNLLFLNIPDNKKVWMSHSDHIEKMPNDFTVLANSENSIAAIKHKTKSIYGIQFHAETTQTEYGSQIISNFIFDIAKCEKDWFVDQFITQKISEIKSVVKKEKIILGLSGGVDSSVAAVLLSKAVGKQLTCIFVDNGLLRDNEQELIMSTYKKDFDINVRVINAQELFYKNLKGITEPEAKRKIIGKLFIDVFEQAAKDLKGDHKFLAQGTIYSDVIESSKDNTASKTIKSHHNVGGMPDDISFEIIEPLNQLFKDEVRAVGRELGLPDKIINRHPFPGPGLGIRVIGEVTKEKCDILRQVDKIFIDILTEENLYGEIDQALAVLLPIKTVGVMGDNRTYEYVAGLRCINTVDFMTATASHLPWSVIDKMVSKIINEVKRVNRVVYDVTSKPPGTIEWE